ncbi:MAG: ankyrin repeat domain-containing protein [Chromatiaceae bacterium]
MNNKPILVLKIFFRLTWLCLAAVLIAACDRTPEPTINLYRAIRVGDLDQIKRHLAWGTDINQAGADGDFPLHVAAKRGYQVVVEELLNHGAALDVRDANHHTPLQAALLAGKARTARVLFRMGGQEDPQALLSQLIEEGVTDRDVLALVIAQGADVNAQDPLGERPLHHAVTGGQILLVKRLIALGAEVNLTDAQGRTPLALANDSRRRDMAALLESFGASPSPTHQHPQEQ